MSALGPLEEDLAELLRQPAGRRFLWWLIDRAAGLHRSSFVGEQPLRNAFAEGKRAVGQEVAALCMRVSTPDYSAMVAEALAERAAELSAPPEDPPEA